MTLFQQKKGSIQTATFAGGCFWCTEAIFRRLKGVKAVSVGYAGGKTDNPRYDEVSTGTTGHAEAVQISFDSSVIPYEKLLDIFWHTHNPTTLNRQGNDVGTQYRSIIFYHTDKQKEEAEKSKEQLQQSGQYADPIVTEIKPYEKFYPAESYHENYYEKNTNAPYCMFVIDPKIQKLLREYENDVKEEYKV